MQALSIHIKAEAPSKPRVEPVRWHASTGSPGWVAYDKLDHREGVAKCLEAMKARALTGSTYNVSMEELTAIWELWYGPRQGGESISVSMRYDAYRELLNAEGEIDPLVGPAPEHVQARNDLFDKLMRGVSDSAYVRKPELDKATTALVEHKPAAAMQTLTLRDGTQVWLRPLEGADAFQMDALLKEGSVSEASFKTRFPDADPSAMGREKLAAQLARRAEQDRGYAVQDATGRILAHMNLESTRHEDTCEFDVLVADAAQGKGLGHALLREARSLAAQAGYQCLRATVADTNERMLKLLTGSGFQHVHNMYALRGHKSYELDLRAPEF